MAGALGDLDNEQKNVYPPVEVDTMVNAEAKFRPWLTRNIPASASTQDGGIIKYGADISGPFNGAQLADGTALPTAYDPTRDQFTLRPTMFSQPYQVGFMARASIKSSKSHLFGSGLELDRQEKAIKQLAWLMDSTYAGTHGTGRRARVAADGAANTFTVSMPEGGQLLRVGMVFSERTTDGGDTVRDSIDNRRITKIDGINTATHTITYSGADQTPVAGDHIHVVAGASQTGLSSLAASGLRGEVDDATFLGTIHGLSRTTYPELKSVVNGNGGTLRNITESLITRTAHVIQFKSEKSVTDIWTSPGQLEKFFEFVAPDRRYEQPANGENFRTGFRQLTHVFPWGVATLQATHNIVPREMYLLNRSTFFLHKPMDMQWTPLELTPGSGGYSASYLRYLIAIENWGTLMPVANGVIRDLRDPAIADS